MPSFSVTRIRNHIPSTIIYSYGNCGPDGQYIFLLFYSITAMYVRGWVGVKDEIHNQYTTFKSKEMDLVM